VSRVHSDPVVDRGAHSEGLLTSGAVVGISVVTEECEDLVLGAGLGELELHILLDVGSTLRGVEVSLVVQVDERAIDELESGAATSLGAGFGALGADGDPVLRSFLLKV